MYYFFKTVLAFVSLFNANLSALIIETPSVYSEVGIEFFNTICVDILLQLFNTQVLSANCSSCVAVSVARSRILPLGMCSPRWIQWYITLEMWATCLPVACTMWVDETIFFCASRNALRPIPSFFGQSAAADVRFLSYWSKDTRSVHTGTVGSQV
jgi:hypothetical protein